MPTPTLDQTRTLLAINAYYHSNGPTGMVVTIEGDNLTAMANLIIEQIADFKRKSVSRDDSEQSLAYASNPENYADDPVMQGDAPKLMSAAAIGYLEEIGAIPSDEHNGLQYVYEPIMETSYAHLEGPMPGLEMYRDLPRRAGSFYFVLTWSDPTGKPSPKIARQMTAAHFEQAAKQFQEWVVDEQYKKGCEHGEPIDKQQFTAEMMPVFAKRAVELLSEAKGEADYRLDAPAGLYAFSFACWVIRNSDYHEQIKSPTLLTIGFSIEFQKDGFVLVALADHGTNVNQITLH